MLAKRGFINYGDRKEATPVKEHNTSWGYMVTLVETFLPWVRVHHALCVCRDLTPISSTSLFWLCAHQATFDYNLVSHICLSTGREYVYLTNKHIPFGLTVLFLNGKTCIGTSVLGIWLTWVPPSEVHPPQVSVENQGTEHIQAYPPWRLS